MLRYVRTQVNMTAYDVAVEVDVASSAIMASVATDLLV